MGVCHSKKTPSKYKAYENARPNIDRVNVNLGPAEMSVSIHHSQFPRILDERQVLDKLDYLMSSDVAFKLRSGIQIKTLINSIKPPESMNDLMMMELARLLFHRIKDQETVLKEYHRYIHTIKQMIEIVKAFLNPVFSRLETEKLTHFFNKNCPFIVFSNILVIFHALIFHKSVLWVKMEDRWWTKNKAEDNLQSLISLIIEIAGKIKYEYEPKFSNKPKNVMLNSRVYSLNSHDLPHEESMIKSYKSNDSRGERGKRESEFFYSGVSPHFTDKINEIDAPNMILSLKHAKSVEEIASKYKTFDEIKEDPDDDEINEEHQINQHKASDCEKYMFNHSPSVKKN